jgi:hypothetical protein
VVVVCAPADDGDEPRIATAGSIASASCVASTSVKARQTRPVSRFVTARLADNVRTSAVDNGLGLTGALAMNCTFVEPPVGIEPTTYALRGRRAVSPALPPALIGHRTPLRAPGHLVERQPRCQNGCQRRRGVPPNPSDLAYASPDSARSAVNCCVSI